ncbi:hypothetical protein FRB98_002007, partial [Tulasnella sp. 332]
TKKFEKIKKSTDKRGHAIYACMDSFNAAVRQIQVADPNARLGIRHKLLLDRIEEERKRLDNEVKNIKVWLQRSVGAAWRYLKTAQSSENAIDIIQARTDDIKVFSDGSGLNGHIGAAAITTGPTNTTLRYYLGRDSAHTIFEAELVGILLALHIIAHCPPRTRSALIALDNQAAIEAVRDNRAQPGQQTIQEIHRMTAKLRQTRHLLQ